MTRDITLLITSGNGPSECHQAVAGVLRRMREEAEARGVGLEAHGVAEKHGLRSAVVLLHGAGAEGLAATWIGTIQWRAKSTVRPGHKRANWFVGVFELPPGPTDASEIARADVVFESFRAGGPGGQHQNKTDSAVRATHIPSGLTAVARDTRSQHRNRALAMERLAQLMSAKHRADEASRKADANHLHKTLERGNPVRCFRGPNFQDVKR